MQSVSSYPHTVLAAWQLALIAIVALGGVAVWLGAVFYAAREPRSRDHAAASVPAAESQASPAVGHPAEPETKQRQRAAA